MIEELLHDEKEKAEHIMLVDLARNDLGRVCHEIVTNNLMDIEKYSHVLHMVSNVTGVLQKDKTSFDLFKASFPAGTVSGAPKIRAMEIIEELEPCERGPYAGALGYFDFCDNLNFCIIIRSVFVKDQQFYIQAGAGIVADSDPEKEYQETKNKALGIVQSLF
jgi:anthranilate synthase component 1